MTSKIGNNAPNVTSWTVNPATNQITNNSATYDANGNMTAYNSSGQTTAFSYDEANRLASVNVPGVGSTSYLYDASNERVFSSATQSVYLYGADGKRIGAWQLTIQGNSTTLTMLGTNVYFGGRLLTGEDRLQSVGKYFPYGEDRYNPTPANPSNDHQKFATYTRDSISGLDYAINRYYSAGIGRFMSADTSSLGVYLGAPASWNSYAYVDNAPTYGNDPTGLFLVAPGTDTEGDFYWDPFFAEYYPFITVNLGGGGGAGAFARALKNLLNAVEAIHSRKAVSADCSKDLAALSKAAGETIDLATIQNALAATTFVNGTTSNLPVSALFRPGAAAAGAAYQRQEDATYGRGQTIENDFKRNPNGLTAETELLGTNIYINPNLISTSLSNDEGLLFHASLHELGLVDTTVQETLGLTVDPKNAANITTKLQNDCITEKGNN